MGRSVVQLRPPVRLAGSTFDDRLKALSKAIRRANDEGDRQQATALFDLAIVLLHRSECSRCCPDGGREL